MRIQQIYIENFGNMSDCHMKFDDGINIIRGDNESGKTTVWEFVRAMLYGLDNERGKSVVTNRYQRYLPWSGGEVFGGTMIISHDNSEYVIKRNFHKRNKSFSCVNISTGENIDENSYWQLDFIKNVSRDVFDNIAVVNAVSKSVPKDMAAELSEHVKNTVAGNGCKYDIAKALGNIDKEYRALKREYDKLDTMCMRENDTVWEGTRVRLHKLRLEAKEIRRNSENSIGDADAGRIKVIKDYLNGYDSIINMYVSLKKLYRNRLIRRVAAIAGIVLCAVILAVFHKHGMAANTICLSGITLCIVELLHKNKKVSTYEHDITEYAKRTVKVSPSESVVSIMERLESEMDNIRGTVEKYDRTLNEKREQAVRDYERITGQITELESSLLMFEKRAKDMDKIDEKMDRLRARMRGVSLAKEVIKGLYEGGTESFVKQLNEVIMEYVNVFTAGAHEAAVIMDDFGIQLMENGEYKRLEAYSRGTINQVNLLVRFAIKQICGYNIPMFFDEAFVCYDDNRLNKVLIKLAHIKDCQMFIFTCTTREEAVLKRSEGMANIWEIKRRRAKVNYSKTIKD